MKITRIPKANKEKRILKVGDIFRSADGRIYLIVELYFNLATFGALRKGISVLDIENNLVCFYCGENEFDFTDVDFLSDTHNISVVITPK